MTDKPSWFAKPQDHTPAAPGPALRTVGEHTWEDRFRGAMLGGAVGDVLGAPVRHRRSADIQQWFAAAGVMDYLPVFGRRGASTDLTQLTLFTLEALLRAKAVNPDSAGWLPTQIVGTNHLRWLYTQGVPWQYAMSAHLKTYPEPNGWLLERPELFSTRNPTGAALRGLGELALAPPTGTGEPVRPPLGATSLADPIVWAAPTMVWNSSEELVFAAGASIAGLLTEDSDVQGATGLHCDVLAQLIRGAGLWDAVSASDTQRLGRAHYTTSTPAGVRRMVHAAMFASAGGRRPGPAELDIEFDTDGTPGELGIALASVAATDSFASAVRMAVNQSADSCVTGALAGQIAGALYGPEAIPLHWLEELELGEIIETLCGDAGEAFAPPPLPRWAQRYVADTKRTFSGPLELPNTDAEPEVATVDSRRPYSVVSERVSRQPDGIPPREMLEFSPAEETMVLPVLGSGQDRNGVESAPVEQAPVEQAPFEQAPFESATFGAGAFEPLPAGEHADVVPEFPAETEEDPVVAEYPKSPEHPYETAGNFEREREYAEPDREATGHAEFEYIPRGYGGSDYAEFGAAGYTEAQNERAHGDSRHPREYAEVGFDEPGYETAGYAEPEHPRREHSHPESAESQYALEEPLAEYPLPQYLESQYPESQYPESQYPEPAEESSAAREPENSPVQEPDKVEAETAGAPAKPATSGGHAKVEGPDPVAPSLTERTLGCFLGGGLGNALGADLESAPADLIAERFGPQGPHALSALKNLNGVNGAITGDTQMTLFTAEGLIRGSVASRMLGTADPLPEVQLAYQRWLHTRGVDWESAAGVFRADHQVPDGWLIEVPGLFVPHAPGNTVFASLARFGEGHPGGSFTEKINDSKGCGGVTRAAPTALYSADPAEVFELAVRTAALTHGHPSGYLSAGALAVIVQQALLGRTLDDGVWLALQVLETWDGHEETSALLKGGVELASQGMPAPQQIERTLGAGRVGEQALAIAVCAALVAGDDFALALRVAVHHSGDSDSTGAICGNIMGALLGVEALPVDWLAELKFRDVIEQIALDCVAEFGGPEFGMGELPSDEQDGGPDESVSGQPTDEDWNDRYPVRPLWSVGQEGQPGEPATRLLPTTSSESEPNGSGGSSDEPGSSGEKMVIEHAGNDTTDAVSTAFREPTESLYLPKDSGAEFPAPKPSPRRINGAVAGRREE